MLRTALAATVALLVLAAPARALPGDPPAVPASPVGGAAVPANPAGVALTFGCPAYRDSPADEVPSDALGGYAVELSRSPTFADGAFAFSSEIARSPADPAQCTATIRDGVSAQPAQVTPGVYFWRVRRSCFCGDGADSESGPVGSFTVTAPAARLTAKAQGRAYAGYPIRVSLATDLPDGQAVVLQRRDGKAWKPVAGQAPTVTKGAADAVVTLGAGKRQLRWVAARGTQTDAGTPATVSVVKARRWSTSRRDDGAYAGTPKLLTRLRVAKGGRELRDLRAAVSVFCIGSPTDASKNYLTVAFAAVKRIRVAPDGRFLVVSEVSKTRAIVSGRLRNGRITGGRISLSYPLCSGGRTFAVAKRS